MMTDEERKAYCGAMQNLTTMLKIQTSVHSNGYHKLIDNHYQFVQTDGAFEGSMSIEQLKKLADIYYILSKAALYREIDPEKLTPGVVDQIR